MSQHFLLGGESDIFGRKERKTCNLARKIEEWTNFLLLCLVQIPSSNN